MKSDNQPFDPAAFWRDHEYKKWVVIVEGGQKRDVKYVSAFDQDGAQQCAIDNCFLPGRLTARARLATPRDLGCVWVADDKEQAA